MAVTINLGENEPPQHRSAGGIFSEAQLYRSARISDRCARAHRLRAHQDQPTPRTPAVALEGSAPSHNRESGGLSGPSVWRQRLGNLLRFAGVGKHFIADDAQCYFMKIGLQGAIKLAELGPKNLIDEAPRGPDHDGVAPLPMKTIGAQLITPA